MSKQLITFLMILLFTIVGCVEAPLDISKLDEDGKVTSSDPNIPESKPSILGVSLYLNEAGNNLFPLIDKGIISEQLLESRTNFSVSAGSAESISYDLSGPVKLSGTRSGKSFSRLLDNSVILKSGKYVLTLRAYNDLNASGLSSDSVSIDFEIRANPTPTPTPTPIIETVTLVNSTSGQVISVLQTGSNFLEENLPNNLNIRALGKDAKSIKMSIAGPLSKDVIDDTPPFDLFSSGQDLAPGTYDLTIRAYSEVGAKGVAGQTLRMTFVIESTPPAEPVRESETFKELSATGEPTFLGVELTARLYYNEGYSHDISTSSIDGERLYIGTGGHGILSDREKTRMSYIEPKEDGSGVESFYFSGTDPLGSDLVPRPLPEYGTKPKTPFNFAHEMTMPICGAGISIFQSSDSLNGPNKYSYVYLRENDNYEAFPTYFKGVPWETGAKNYQGIVTPDGKIVALHRHNGPSPLVIVSLDRARSFQEPVRNGFSTAQSGSLSNFTYARENDDYVVYMYSTRVETRKPHALIKIYNKNGVATADRIATDLSSIFPSDSGISFAGKVLLSFTAAPPRNNSGKEQILFDLKSDGLWVWDPATPSEKARKVENRHSSRVIYVNHNNTTYRLDKDGKIYKMTKLDGAPQWELKSQIKFLQSDWLRRTPFFHITPKGGIWLATKYHKTRNGSLVDTAAAYYAPRQ